MSKASMREPGHMLTQIKDYLVERVKQKDTTDTSTNSHSNVHK